MLQFVIMEQSERVKETLFLSNKTGQKRNSKRTRDTRKLIHVRAVLKASVFREQSEEEIGIQSFFFFFFERTMYRACFIAQIITTEFDVGGKGKGSRR